MDSAILFLMAAGLFLAWVIGPTVVLHYRLVIVPRRFEEIRDRFMSNNPGEALTSQDDRTKSGAWHYARLLDPDADPAEPEETEEVIRRQFWHFHGWNRYGVPFTLVIVISGLMLAFSGCWLADRLSPPKLTTDLDKSTGSPAGFVITNGTVPSLDESKALAKSTTNPAAHAKNASVGGVLSRIPVPFVMALWGAYVWSLYEILRRRKSGDLTPVELYEIASRYIIAIPIGYAFSLLVFDTVPALAAFGISAFPMRDIQQFFRKYILKKFDDKNQGASAVVATGYLGDTLCGLGKDTVARLEELNIETWLDLAYADPIKLLIKTGVPIELVLSWIDQAMVSVYAAPHKAALTSYCMPCALDLCEFYVCHCWDVMHKSPKNWQNDTYGRAAVEALANKLGMPPSFVVEHLLRGVFEDPHTRFLVRVWFGPATSPDDI